MLPNSDGSHNINMKPATEEKKLEASPRRGHGHRRMGSLVKGGISEEKKAAAGAGLVPSPSAAPVLVGNTSFAHPPSPAGVRSAHRRNKSYATGSDFASVSALDIPNDLRPGNGLLGAAPRSPSSRNISPAISRVNTSGTMGSPQPSGPPIIEISGINSAPITLSVELEGHRELKVETPTVSVSLAPSKPVQSLLNTLSTTYGIKPDVLARYVLKSYAYDTAHVNSSKHKVEMDPLYSISFYGLKEGDSVYLKKRKKSGITTSFRSKRLSVSLVLHIQIENSEELKCAKETTVVLESECTTDELFEKIASEGNIPITEMDRPNYSILIIKPDGRTVRADQGNQILSYLCADDKDILRVIKRMPYKTIYDKFRVVEGRSPKEIAFELAVHSIIASTSKHKTASDTDKSTFTNDELQPALNHLGASLNLDSIHQSRIVERVKHSLVYGKEPILLEYAQRIQLVNQNLHPKYLATSFENDDSYQMWKKRETQHIKDNSASIIFNPEGYYGVIAVRVIEAKDIVSSKKGSQLDTYCVVKIDHQPESTADRFVRKTKTVHKQSEPTWDEEFMLEVLNPNAYIHVILYESENIVSQTRFYLMDIAEKDLSEDWFTLEDGKTQVHLFLEYNYSFSQYYRFICTGEGTHVHVNSSKMDAVLDYAESLDILMSGLSDRDSSTEKRQRISSSDDRDSLFSRSSEKILSQYRDRFGIRQVLWEVSLIKYTNQHFRHKLSMLQELHTTLASLQKRSHQDLTPKEWELFLDSATELCEKLTDVFTNYRKSFPENTPERALTTALRSYRLLLTVGADKASKEKAKQMAMDTIQDCLTNAVDSNFAALKKQYKEDSSSNVTSMSQPSAHYMLSFILKKMLKDAEAEMKFCGDFEDYGVEFAEHVSGQYRKLLVELARQFCEEAAYENSDVFELYFRLRELDTNRFYASSASTMTLNLADSFQPFIYGWIKETKNNVERVAVESVAKDTCMMLDNDRSSSNSVSLFDVCDTLTNAMEFLKSLRLDHPFVIIQFTEVICNAMEKFVNTTFEKAMSLLRSLPPKDYSPPITICILMNNIESARERLDVLLVDLEDELQESSGRTSNTSNGLTQDILRQTFDDCTRGAFETSRTTLEKLVNSTSEKINEHIRNTINTTIAAQTQSVSVIAKQLRQYVEQQLQLLMDNLQPIIFTRISKRIWQLIVANLHSIAAAKNQDLLQSQIRQILPVLEELAQQFQMKGKGLQKAYLDEAGAPVKRLLEMWTQPSSALISMWWKLKEPMAANDRDDQEEDFSRRRARTALGSSQRYVPTDSPSVPRRERTTITESDVMSILERRSDSVEARAFVDEQRWILEDVPKYQAVQAVREHFGMPLWEVILKNYGPCTMLTNDVKSAGLSFLTSNYLAFDVRVDGVNSGVSTMLALKEIKTLQKTKHAFFWDAILIEMRNGRVYSFFDWKNRDLTWKDICDQTIAVGNSNFVTEKKE